jgi:hypothetical protein
VALIHFDVAKNAFPRKRHFQRGVLMLFLSITALPMTGCMSSGIGKATFFGPDRSITTSSVPEYSPLLTDDDIIKTTVSQANVDAGYLQDIAWTNTGTGNGGTISYIRENRSVGKICREFIASKHSYDGVSQYLGEICRTRMGKSWSFKSMEKQG